MLGFFNTIEGRRALMGSCKLTLFFRVSLNFFFLIDKHTKYIKKKGA